MRFSIILAFCFSITSIGLSQDKATIEKISIHDFHEGHFLSDWIDIKPLQTSSNTAVAITSSNSQLHIEYNIKGENKWYKFTKNAHQNTQVGAIPYAWISNLIFFSDDNIRFRTLEKNDIQLTVIKTESQHNKLLSSISLKCKCDSIQLKTREVWCPDGDCPIDTTPVPTDAKFLIVHHSAGGFDAEDYDAVVRSYYRFHVDTRGWDDIGYNYLVSPDGVIYEGRGDGLLGAHFCGKNGNTEGICMIGDYTETFPTEVSIRALNELLAYRSCEKDIKVDSSSYHNSSNLTLRHISGHRDGCNTTCPGDILYGFLPFTTDLVEDIINDSCQIPTPQLSISFTTETAELNWDDPYDYEEQYILEYSLDNENFIILESLPANSNSYLYDLSLGNPIYFRVRAFLDGTDGPCSNVVELLFSSNKDAVDKEANEEISVYNLFGTKLFTSHTFSLTQDISPYHSGIYIIRYESNRSKLYYKN